MRHTEPHRQDASGEAESLLKKRKKANKLSPSQKTESEGAQKRCARAPNPSAQHAGARGECSDMEAGIGVVPGTY